MRPRRVFTHNLELPFIGFFPPWDSLLTYLCLCDLSSGFLGWKDDRSLIAAAACPQSKALKLVNSLLAGPVFQIPSPL